MQSGTFRVRHRTNIYNLHIGIVNALFYYHP
jgi:hypothetical protein